MIPESDQQILLERAKKNAKKRDTHHHYANEVVVVEFSLFPEKYAVEAEFVKEVLTLKEITPIPGLPDWVFGVTNYRGSIISIINLKVLFALKEKGLTEMNKAILLSNGKMEFGLVADSITGSHSVIKDELAAPPLNLSEIGSEFMVGITKNSAILLDAAKMLESKILLINQ